MLSRPTKRARGHGPYECFCNQFAYVNRRPAQGLVADRHSPHILHVLLIAGDNKRIHEDGGSPGAWSSV